MIFDWCLKFGGPVPPESRDDELRERALTMLKNHPLCRNTSRRLVIDMIDKVGIARVGRGGAPPIVEHKQPAILVVLEGALVVDDGAKVVVLQPGVYLRNDPQFVGVEWVQSTMRGSPDGNAEIAVFLVDIDAITALPVVMVSAMDTTELIDLWGALEI